MYKKAISLSFLTFIFCITYMYFIVRNDQLASSTPQALEELLSEQQTPPDNISLTNEQDGNIQIISTNESPNHLSVTKSKLDK